MVNYTNCPYEYRGKLKVFLIPWEHTNAEFESVYKGWKADHFLNLDKPGTFEFSPNPMWKDCQE